MTIGLLKMPRLGETMEEGKLSQWLVAPGQAFRRGQDILEVETDKTVVEYPALGDGTLVETLVDLGDLIPVGTPIARIDVGDGPDWTDDGDGDAKAEAPAEARGPVPGAAGAGAVTVAAQSDRVRATPLARRIARQRGIDLQALTGSGRRGRIERADVEAAARAPGDVRQVAGVTVLEKGPASGVPVLLLHGFGADHSAWGGLQSRLSALGRRTVAVDLPGHGSTVHEAGIPADLAPPVERAIDGLDAPHLVAHSMGAIPAVRIARTVGAASLTLIAPAGLGHGIDAGFLRGLAGVGSAGELSHLLGRTTDGPHGLSAAILDRIFADLYRRRLTALADALLGGSGQAVNLRTELADLAGTMPVHLIVGHRDRILDWREMLDVSPRIAVHHLPRAGHSPHWEALADVTAILNGVTT